MIDGRETTAGLSVSLSQFTCCFVCLHTATLSSPCSAYVREPKLEPSPPELPSTSVGGEQGQPETEVRLISRAFGCCIEQEKRIAPFSSLSLKREVRPPAFKPCRRAPLIFFIEKRLSATSKISRGAAAPGAAAERWLCTRGVPTVGCCDARASSPRHEHVGCV